MNSFPENFPKPKTHSNQSEAMPFYIVCDVSESMHGDKFAANWGSVTSPWQLMNMELSGLAEQLQEEEEARDIAYIATVEFSGNAHSVSKLTVVSAPPIIPTLSKGGWTNYVGAWEYLANLVPNDVEELRQQDRHVERPTIFFITDGNPGSSTKSQIAADWLIPYDKLAHSLAPIEPRVVSIGIGDVNRQTLLELHSKNPHGAAVIANEAGQSSKLIHPVIEQIKNSVRNSASSGAFTWSAPAGMTNLCDKVRH